MTNIHSLHMLPEQSILNMVANTSNEFDKKDFNYVNFVASLKHLMVKSNFLTEHDHSYWAKSYGSDYLYNPKLFAYAPLTHVYAFLSEAFKHSDLERIKVRYPQNVLKQALSRLSHFTK